MTTFVDAFLSRSSRAGAAVSGAGGATLALTEQIAALKDMARRIAAPCPFKVGDLVTVRPGMDLKGAGKVHVVVEVLPEAVCDTTSEPGSNRFLSNYTMRVAHYCGTSMTVHAVDHAVFEVWTDAHAAAVTARESEPARSPSRPSLKPDMALTEVVRLLRDEGRRMAEAKITWKKGELVEILGHETSHAARPMLFGGRAVGLVESVDFSDDTTRVFYFDDSGTRRAQWFKPLDLRPFAAVEPVPA